MQETSNKNARKVCCLSGKNTPLYIWHRSNTNGVPSTPQAKVTNEKGRPGAAQRMRNSFAFLPVRQKQRFGSVKPSPATVRRTVALKSSNPSAEWQNKNTTHRVVFLFWQRMRDSNPRERSQSPVCYRYTNPLSSRFIIRNFSEKSTLRPEKFQKNSPVFTGEFSLNLCAKPRWDSGSPP